MIVYAYMLDAKRRANKVIASRKLPDIVPIGQDVGLAGARVAEGGFSGMRLR